MGVAAIMVAFRAWEGFSVGEARKRKCIFCGGGPLSQQHMWPDRFKSFVPRNEKTTHIHDVRSGSLVRAGEWKRGGPLNNKGDIRARKLKVVCRNAGPEKPAGCNDGWISRVEEEAYDVVKKLASDNWNTISYDEARRLANWFAVAVVVFEQTVNEDRRVLSEPIRQEIMLRRGATEQFMFWVGRTADWDDGIFAVTSATMSDYEDGSNPYYKNITTIQINDKVFLQSLFQIGDAAVVPAESYDQPLGLSRFFDVVPLEVSIPPLRHTRDQRNLILDTLRESFRMADQPYPQP